MVKVMSSAMDEVVYRATSKALYIFFLDGSVVVHHDVPIDVYQALIGAQSVGAYYNFNVRPNYRFSWVKHKD